MIHCFKWFRVSEKQALFSVQPRLRLGTLSICFCRICDAALTIASAVHLVRPSPVYHLIIYLFYITMSVTRFLCDSRACYVCLWCEWVIVSRRLLFIRRSLAETFATSCSTSVIVSRSSSTGTRHCHVLWASHCDRHHSQRMSHLRVLPIIPLNPRNSCNLV